MATDDSSSHLATAPQRSVLTEQVMLFCRLSRVALISSGFAGLFVCYLLLKEFSPYKVATWFALLIATIIIRGYYQKRVVDGHIAVDRRLIKKLLVIIAIHGTVWSLPSTWLIPQEPTNQVILSLFMVGLSANSLISLTPLRHAYSIFVGTMMLPIAALYFWKGDYYATSAIGIVAYTVFMILGGKRQTAGTEDLLRLQLDNAALAANIQREKEVVDRANRDLKMQIEQRERTEAALRSSKAEAEAANRAKSHFLANMSHELRTPLNGILGTSELLLRSLPNMGQLTKHLKYTQTIRGAGERLLYLISDILDMARIEAGALRLESTRFAPRELITEVVDLMTTQCNDKGLTLTVNVSPQVPDALCGDSNRLRQILSNLVVNAIKFTERGGIEIRVERALSTEPTQAENQVALRWSVTDSGIGIADHARAQLFQPFSQLDDSPTRKFGGTGLGLAICQQLVRAMGGCIDVETRAGRGSTFWFELSFAVSVSVPALAPAVPETQTTHLTGRILIAEDNVINSQLVMEMLELAGCKATIANNGLEAIATLEEQHFDLVLMDWHMPEMDGVAATRAWRKRERSETGATHLPIIALTASVLPGDRDTCLKAGMDDFLAKPFSYDELIAMVQRWLPKQANAMSEG